MLQLPAQGMLCLLLKQSLMVSKEWETAQTGGITDRRVSAATADDLEIRAHPLHKMTSKDTKILGCPVGALSDSEAGGGETREEGRIFLT